MQVAGFMRTIGLAAAVASVVQLAHAGLFQQQHRFRGASGQPIMVGARAMTNRRCQPNGAPTITVTTPPAHGTISTQPGTHVIVHSVGTIECDGRTVADTQIFYTSVPGFHGRDHFHLTIGLGTSTIEDDITVRVD